MKSEAKLSLLDFLAAALIIVTAMSITVCILLLSKPFKQKGEAPGLSASSQEPSAWNGSFSNFLLCGIDNSGKSADAILLVSFNNRKHLISILQIPRETWAGNGTPSHLYGDYYSRHAKNVSGMENLKACVERDFSIHVDYYAAFTLKGFRRLVDAFGGIDLDVPQTMNYDDPVQNLHIHLESGAQHLTGSAAEQLVRYRGGPSGDLERLASQRLCLSALAEKLSGIGTVSLPAKLIRSLKVADFTTDLDNLDLISFVLAAKKVGLSRVKIGVMPGDEVEVGNTVFFRADKSKLSDVLNAEFFQKSGKLKKSSIKLPEISGEALSAAPAGNGSLQSLLSNSSG